MTETDAKSVEHTRFLRELRKLVPPAVLAIVAIEVIARGLWDTFITRFLPSNAPRGDVGRFTNEDIAEGVGWLGNADELVEAMIRAGRLASHHEHRLIVVDWHRLAPSYLKSNIKHAGGFVTIETEDRNEDRNACPNENRNEDRNDGVSPPVLSSLSSSSLSSSSLSSSSSPLPPPSLGDTWEGVEVDLLSLGVRQAKRACSEAIGHGCRVVDVIAVIAHYRCRNGAWDAGALFERIIALRPGQNHAELWAEPKPTFNREQERQATARSHEAVVAERLAGDQRREAENRRRAALDDRWGAIIAGLNGEQVVAALGDDVMLVGMYRRKGLCASVRERISEVFELQEAVA